MDKRQEELELQIEENGEESNEILHSLDKKFEKFDSIFNSMKMSLDAQTKILQRSLDIQLDAVESGRKTDLLEKVKDDKTSQLSVGQEIGQDAKGLLGDAKGAFSLDGLVAGGLLVFLAPIVADFIKDFATQFFENIGFDGEFSDSVASALGAAGFWGSIGLIFGRRLGAILAVGGFIEDFFNVGENTQAMLDAIGIELGDGTAEAIGVVIGGALALALPKILGRALPALFQKGAGAITRGIGTSGAAAAVEGALGQGAQRTAGAGQGPVFDERLGRYRDPVSGKMVKAPTAAAPAPAPTTSSGIGSKIAKGFKGVGGILNVGLAAFQAGSALMDDSLSSNQTAQEVAGAAGGAGGAWAGAAAGAAIGSVVPIVGTAIGGALGGAIGYFAGDWLGRTAVGEAGYDPETVNKLKTTDPTTLNEEELTRYFTELQEQYKAAVGVERELMNSDMSQTPDYEYIQKQISELGSLLSSAGIDPASVASKEGGYSSPNEGITYNEQAYFKSGTKGFQQFGNGTPALLHGSEAVVPESTIAGQVLKSMFSNGWNSLDVTGISSAVTKGIDYITQQSTNMSNVGRNAPAVIAPVTNNNIYQGGNSSTNSSTVVLGSTGMDLDRPGYAR